MLKNGAHTQLGEINMAILFRGPNCLVQLLIFICPVACDVNHSDLYNGIAHYLHKMLINIKIHNLKMSINNVF